MPSHCKLRLSEIIVNCDLKRRQFGKAETVQCEGCASCEDFNISNVSIGGDRCGKSVPKRYVYTVRSSSYHVPPDLVIYLLVRGLCRI
jgi:hypothetical protein